MEFKLLDDIISFDESKEAYNKYRLMFQKEADRAEQAFSVLYQQNASLDETVSKVPDQVAQCLQPVIEVCVRVLLQHNVLTIDETQFEAQYSSVHDIWSEPFLKVCDQYAEIVMDQKALDEYRVARRQGRSRWVGGGFGLSGALEGAATAGALNLVSGAAHMVFNGVGKIVSSISANMQKNRIFRDPETYSSIAQGVWDAAFSLHFALIDCLDHTGADSLPLAGVPRKDDVQNATALLNNAKLTQDTEQRRLAMVRSLRLNPYQKEWYRFALTAFGDSDSTLECIEQYFGLSVIQEAKIHQLDALAESLPLDTEEQAQEAVRKISQLKEQLHYFGETEQTQIVLNVAERFDEEYRTIDGITLPSRTEADLVRTELSAIEKIESHTNFESLSSIAHAQQEISAFTSAVAKAHQQELHKKWVALDENLRTVSTLLPNGKAIRCKTIQQAEQLRPTVQTLYRRLEACGDGEAAEGALIALKAHLITENLPSALTTCYAKEIDNRLNAIDLDLRTTLGKEYPSRTAAREAEKQYQKIKADFETGKPRKNAARFRSAISAADFSDTIKMELLDELFQLENSREIKTAKAFSAISTVILLVIVIGSYFFQLSGTSNFARKDVVVMGVSLMVKDTQIVEDFSFVDGLKNGFVVFGRCIGDVFVGGFHDYVGGFDYGWIGNILWAIFGLCWIIFKHCIILLPRYFVSLVLTFLQSAPITYHIGYVIGSAIPLAVSQLTFDEDEQEENVKRIKGRTAKKVLLTVFVVLIVAVITICLAQRGQ